MTSLFGGANGIATQLDSLINQYTQSGGLLDSINQGLQSSLSDVANQQDALNTRLAAYSATLTKEYNAMDTAVALLKQTQTYLTAEFNPQSSGLDLAGQQSIEQRHPQAPAAADSSCTRRTGAAQYRAVRSHGLVADASPTRLVQIMFEQILAHLAAARGAMERIQGNRPVGEVVAKSNAISKAMALISQLNGTLDMDRGGQVASNLRSLYEYMIQRMTLANATNDPRIAAEIAGLVGEIKSGWDQIVTDSR